MAKGIDSVTGMNHRFIDMTGVRNHRLVYIKYIGVNKHKHSVWLTQCDCGNFSEITSKKTKSCGCLQKEIAANRARARGLPEEERSKRLAASRKKRRDQVSSCPAKAMGARLSRLHRHALAQVGAIKNSPTFAALGYTADDFRIHIEKQFTAGMGWHNMKEWQIDHIIPISQAATEADVIALNQLSNLRPLWSTENNLKRDQVVTLL